MTSTIKPTIKLHSGIYYNFLNPEMHRYDIEDISHGLSNICRFNGQCKEFYSVAQHSVFVSYIVEQYTTEPLFVFSGLMHDISESLLGDMTKPLKEMMSEYKKLEARTEGAMFKYFYLPAKLPKIVKVADEIALRTEQRDFMNCKDTDNWFYSKGIEPMNVKLKALNPEAAKKMFLKRFEELYPVYLRSIA